MTRCLYAAVAAVILACGTVAAQEATPSAPASRTIFVTVTDRNGTPVEDLTASDFEIKEGGKTVVVDDAGITGDPMAIAIIVDDNGTGLFRWSLAMFVQKLDGRGVMALSTVVGQTMKLVDYTPRIEAILQGSPP